MEKLISPIKHQPECKPLEPRLDHAELPEAWRRFYEQVRQSRLAQTKKDR